MTPHTHSRWFALFAGNLS